MNITVFTRGRRWAALLAAAPLVAACGGQADPGAPAGGAPPVLRPGAHLVITTGDGVRLRPADGDRAVTEARIGSGWSHRDGLWVLDLSCPRHEGHEDGRCPRMPAVGVPAGVSVTVTARNAGIDATGITAGLDLTTVDGDVTVTRSGEDDATVRLVTRNGSVRTGALRAAGVHAATENGDVTLGSATSPARVTASTTNGSVRVSLPHGAPAYDVAATTRNGRASVAVPAATRENGHEMRLSTVNGDVTAVRD